MKKTNRRDFLKNLSIGSLVGTAAGSLLNVNCSVSKNQKERKPNFVIFLADNMGYGDWNRGGHPTIHTPHLNSIADEGVQMTQFYSASPVCSPTRASLLTGRHHIRTGITHVFRPGNGRGMPRSEITIAQALKSLGYTSACIGKWHLGSTHEYRPLRYGFDYYYGILYSNDMWEPKVYQNDEIIEPHPINMDTLTKRYTEEALAFIERSKNQPFFLYMPYTMPHIPIGASEKFRGTSRRGLYGDAIEEIDWSVGEVLALLERLGLTDDTLVMFTSDNGPWPWDSKRENGGSVGLFRGYQANTWEGGMRVPFIARWHGHLPTGRISMEVGSVIDFFPTCVTLAGGKIPDDRPIDGINMMSILKGEKSVERTIFYYTKEKLSALRKGKWKIHFICYFSGRKASEHNPNFLSPEGKRNWVKLKKPLLFDLEADPSEYFDLADKYPNVVKELTEVAEKHKEEIRRNKENQDLLDWFINDWHTAPRIGE